LTPFEILFVAHLVGDWILAQTDWEAMNKARHWGACLSHAGKWTLVMALGVAIARGFTPAPLGLWAVVLANGGAHALIDRRTPVLWLMRVKEYIPVGSYMARAERRDPPFWLVICVDQVLHIVQVAILAIAVGAA
jgi:hypothetical protein